MKKLFLTIFLLGLSIFGNSQTINLTFIAEDLNGDTLAIDSLNIFNISVGCDTTLIGSSTSIDIPVIVGVEDKFTDFKIQQNFPNPFAGSTIVEMTTPKRDNAYIILFDNLGRKLSEYSKIIDRGTHSFRITTNVHGLTILSVRMGGKFQSIKMINTSNCKYDNSISYIGKNYNELKFSPSIDFMFFAGDSLQYTAFSDGYNNEIFSDNPGGDTTYVFPMSPDNMAEVITDTATEITGTTAISGGEVISNGGSDVTARGVCWDTASNPTILNNHTSDSSGIGHFVSYITQLTEGTLYYTRAYAINLTDTSYGNELSFTTLDFATVTTNTVINITQTSATSGGNVTSDGGSSVTSRGVCWDTASNPTTSNSHTSNGSGIGEFISYLNGLTCGTTYYTRAYAINGAGTAYGNELTFTTDPGLPTVTTSNITNIGLNSVTSGGNVTSDGGENVTSRGICWGTSPNPTISGNHTSNGSGLGTFVSNVTGLTTNTLYYIRAYATNSVGTVYGEELGFTTLLNPCAGTPTVTYEGHVYNTVQIGTQCWLRENLNVGVKIDGNSNQTDNSVIEKWCYNNLESNCDAYGALYQWNEIMQYVNTPAAQGICPPGWHIPTNSEYATLEIYASSESDKLRETGTAHWDSENGATNDFNFTAVGAGHRTSGFDLLKNILNLWTSDEQSVNEAWHYDLNNSVNPIISGYSLKESGFSVRCIKN